jgi:hypothetical protein
MAVYQHVLDAWVPDHLVLRVCTYKLKEIHQTWHRVDIFKLVEVITLIVVLLINLFVWLNLTELT